MRINCGIGAARLAVAAVLAIAAAAPRAMQDSIQLQTVELNYRDRCARCHGDALQGGRASSLIDTVWAWGGDDASIARSIRTGHASAGMPQVADGLSDGEVRALVILIRERAAARAPRWWTPEDDRRIFESERHPFKLETVVDGLHEPWSFALLSDGRKLITEKSGRLRIVEGGRLLPDPIAGTPSAWSKGQGGLLDVVAHPKFAENGWIYITYSDPGPGELAMTAVARGRIVENTWVQQQRLFNLPKDVYRHSSIHFGSRIAFDRTGLLYFSVGDRGFGEDAQDLTRPNGKIHRIAEDGTLPADNPIVGVVDGLRTIWTFGNRNPQGLAFHPVTGDLWEVEQGPRGGDELNRLVGGHNYGWPLVSEGMNYDGTAIVPPKSVEGLDGPVHHWTPSIAVSSLAFYTGDRFPEWKNDLFVTSLTYQDVRRLVLEGNRVVHEEILFRNRGRVRQIVDGPDGYLYVVFNTPDRVVRIMPATR